MTKLKNNLRKSMRRTNKQRQKTKRSRKSRKLRRQTRNRRSKMRGGMNMKGLLVALLAAAKTDNKFITSRPGLENLNSVDQLSFVKENTSFLQKKINDGMKIEIPNDFDLQSYIDVMNNKKDGTDAVGFEQMLANDVKFKDYKSDESDVKSDESGYSKEQYFKANNIPSSSL